MAMSKTSRLRFDALEERSDEVCQTSQAIGCKIVLPGSKAADDASLKLPNQARSTLYTCLYDNSSISKKSLAVERGDAAVFGASAAA